MKIKANTNYDSMTRKRYLIATVHGTGGWKAGQVAQITFRPFADFIGVAWWTWPTRGAFDPSFDASFARKVDFYITLRGPDSVCAMSAERVDRTNSTDSTIVPFPGYPERWADLMKISIGVAAHRCPPELLADHIMEFQPEPWSFLATDTPRRLFEALCPVPLAVKDGE